MNDLEFRRALYADPESSDQSIKEALENDAEKTAFYNEMQEFNAAIKTTVNVPVPDGLEARLLQIAKDENSDDAVVDHKVVSLKPRRASHIVQLAMAASVAFAFGLSFSFIGSNSENLTGAELAMAHLYHEENYAMHADSDVNLNDVNAKLASFGAEIPNHFGRVTFANYCYFENQKSLHLVVETEFGRVTFFITPKDLDNLIDSKFGDEKYRGRSWQLDNADLTIIGEKGRTKDDDFKKLRNYVKYST